MVIVKTPEQIEGIRKSCRHLAEVLDAVGKMIEPGITTREINAKVEQMIEETGGKPAFKGYRAIPGGVPFPAAVCTSVNDVVVHGIALSDEPLKEGDVIGVDCGINLNGYFSDMARTFPVGEISDAHKQLLQVTEQAELNGIKQIKPGNTIRAIAEAVQNTITPHGYGIVRGFAGHGVGVQVHEDPWIPNYIEDELDDSLNVVMQAGHIFAIEPMITTGGEDVDILNDGWTVKTTDGSISAHFEDTVLVTEDGHEILTR